MRSLLRLISRRLLIQFTGIFSSKSCGREDLRLDGFNGYKTCSKPPSRVLANGDQSRYFDHRRGLRQSDPLSPMMFIIAADVLQRFIEAANSTLMENISNRVQQPIMALQYADDTVIVANGSLDTVITLKLILRLFAQVSGLDINYNKSCFLTLNMNPQQTFLVQQVLGCKTTEFPITYLGMPLSITMPRRQDYMPLIEKLDRRLQGWQGKMLSRGRRLQLIKSVLSSIPIYYMTCFELPKWVLNMLDSIRRQFLWRKGNSNDRGISLINWNLVCRPRKWGGLGLTDLSLQNKALLLRWWWRLYSNPNSLWTTVMRNLKNNGDHFKSLTLWIKGGSFFWKHLWKIHPLFLRSITWEIGNGRGISFWFDGWSGTSICDIGQLRPPRLNCSLRDAFTIMPMLTPEEIQKLHQVNLSNTADVVIWRLESSGVYSAKSAYQTLAGMGKIRDRYAKLWRYKIPETVKVFAYLLLKRRLLTHDVMARRNIRCTLDCVMCTAATVETIVHLLFKCSYSVQIWRAMSIRVGRDIIPRGDTLPQIWKAMIQGTEAKWKREGPTIILCACWFVWRQRKETIFNNRWRPPEMLAEQILQEAQL